MERVNGMKERNERKIILELTKWQGAQEEYTQMKI